MNYIYLLTNNSYVLYSTLGVILLILTLFTFSRSFQRIFLYKNKYLELDYNDEQFRIFFLFFGCVIPIIEIIVTQFKLRHENHLVLSFATSGVLLLFYFISNKISLLARNITKIFRTLFFFYFILNCYWVFFRPFELISLISLIATIFLSYFVIKNIFRYWVYTLGVFGLFVISYYENYIPSNYNVLLICTFISIISIHMALHFTNIANKYKSNFLDVIINNGNSLIIVTNKKGELNFCSKSIKLILGYHSNEVLGLKFWKLTEDLDFVGEAYHNNFIDDRTYIRKHKCKSGEYKYIQWKDKMYSDDLIIGIGQDVTEQISIQNQYTNLIESAVDFIYEINLEACITFLNSYTEKTLGYSKEGL